MNWIELNRVKEKLINTKKFTFNLPAFQILEETCTVDTVVGSCVFMLAKSMTENGLDIYFLFTGDVLVVFVICLNEWTSVLNK